MLVKLRYGVEHRQAGAGSTLRVVVVGLGIAEVCHYTVTKVLRDTPAKALDGLRCRTMVLADDLAPLFGIEMASYLSRADKIAEQYRQMPPLAGWRVACFRLRTDRRGSVQWRCALRAELGLGWVLETALLTSVREGGCALNAELRALGIFR
ncbi:MAG: hypothetical protein WCA59_12990 [Candidatus Binataceae bacterium]